MKEALFLFLALLISTGSLVAQNPFITDQFTADPTARVFEGKMYVYPSHDVDCGTDWICMKDYHVFSSENLVDWTDHGVILAFSSMNNKINYPETEPSGINSNLNWLILRSVGWGIKPLY